ncbi:EamA family transporter [Silvanigrella sp.]|jgi:drug/metabolite transporter (DMT)-like permease|uniref:EamA family transporter n=1 Tax=Silvanigrella sp. TaxID=2024976 RepID=UPI0037C86D2D
MWIVLAIFSSIIFGIASVLMKSATIKKCPDQYILFGLYFSGSLFFLYQSFSVIDFIYSYHVFLWSVLIALGSFFGNWFVIKALELGPASLTAPMLNLNLPFIILMSVFIYGEELNLIKILIILTLFIAIIIVKIDPNENLVIKNKNWFICVILGSTFLFLREGGLKITQELNINNTQILLYSYFLCLIFSGVILFKKEIKNLNLKSDTSNKIEFKKLLLQMKKENNLNGIYYGLITGICSGLGLYLYSKALLTGPTSLVALIFSARSLIIVLLSYFLHKERLSLFQKFSVFLLCLGLSLASFI